MKKFLLILLILGCAVPCFAKKRIEENIITPVTQLEKRQFQTRTYSADDKIAVMKALLNTLQDEGYMVNNVNSLLGFIYGMKDFDTTDPNIDISREFGFTKSRLNYNGVKVATLEFAANITEYGDSARVRVNFKRKLLNEYGNAQFIDDVDDAEFYDEFYKKAENNLNLQKQIKKEVPAANKTPVINDVLPASVQDNQIEKPKPQAVEQTKTENQKPAAKVKTEEIKSDKPSKNVKEKAKEESMADNTKAEDKEPISKKEYKKQLKQQEKMLKELEKEEKIRQKLLKEQEKQEAKEQAKVIKQLNKAEKN